MAEENNEEIGGAGADPGWIIITAFFALIDVIEFIGVFFNLTGVWTLIVLALNLFAVFVYTGWKIMTEGFSFKTIFGSWKQAAWLIIDQIPVVGDVVPGLILFMLGIKKKKTGKTK